MLAVDETIVAIASPPRGGQRGIVRLSGPQVIDCLRDWFHANEDWTETPTASVIAGRLQLDDAGRQMPCDLYLWPTSRSYTKQPAAELHTVGSLPLLQRIVSNVCETGARLARPGEFTLRAFLAGRLDLPQAEAVLGVIDARSDRQLDVALSQLAGGLSTHMHQLRDDLLNLTADLEAGLDFVDEDISFISREAAEGRLESAIDSVQSSIAQMQSRSTPTDMPRVALVGNPNVGKSTLFNALVRKDMAIVSHVAGTTRDYIRAAVEIGGMPCELIDTAGIETPLFDEDGELLPSGHAQKMASAAAQRATLLVLCVDMSVAPTPKDRSRIVARDRDRELLVGTKSDLPCHHDNAADFDVEVCAGQGSESLERLEAIIAERLSADHQLAGETVVTTALRCRRSLQDCESSLKRAIELCKSSAGDELVVAELRLALDAIGHVVGAVYTDDVLDRVFSRFCIGK